MKRVLKKAGKLMAGQGTFLLAQWVVISYLAHTAGAAAVGQYSLAVSLTTPAAVLLGLAGRTVLQMDTGANGLPFRTHFQLRLITTLMFILSGIAIMLWRSDDPVLAWLILAMTAMKAVDNFSDITYGLAQRHHHQDIMSTSMVVRGLMSAGLFIGAYAYTGSMPLGAMAVTLGWLLFYLAHDWPRTRQWHGQLWQWQPTEVLKLAKSSLPLGIAVFLSGFTVVVPRLVLEHYEGLETLGVFAALGYTLTLGNLFVNALSTTMLTRLGELWTEKNIREFMRRAVYATTFLASAGVVGVIAAYLFGQIILTVLYGESFSQYTDLFIVVSMSVCLVMIATLWGSILLATRNYNYQLVLDGISLALIVVVCIPFIINFGIYGAVYAMTVVSIAKMVLCGTKLTKEIRKLSNAKT